MIYFECKFEVMGEFGGVQTPDEMAELARRLLGVLEAGAHVYNGPPVFIESVQNTSAATLDTIGRASRQHAHLSRLALDLHLSTREIQASEEKSTDARARVRTSSGGMRSGLYSRRHSSVARMRRFASSKRHFAARM